MFAFFPYITDSVFPLEVRQIQWTEANVCGELVFFIRLHLNCDKARENEQRILWTAGQTQNDTDTESEFSP